MLSHFKNCYWLLSSVGKFCFLCFGFPCSYMDVLTFIHAKSEGIGPIHSPSQVLWHICCCWCKQQTSLNYYKLIEVFSCHFFFILSVWGHRQEYKEEGSHAENMNMLNTNNLSHVLGKRKKIRQCNHEIMQSCATLRVSPTHETSVFVGLLKPNSVELHFKTKNLNWHLSRLKQQWLQENQFPFWNKCGVIIKKRTFAAWTAMYTHLQTAFFQFNQQYLNDEGSRNFNAVNDWHNCFCSSTLPFRVLWKRHFDSNVQHSSFVLLIWFW